MTARRATESELNGAIERLNKLVPMKIHLARWKRGKYRAEGPNGTTPLGREWLNPTDLYNQLWLQVQAIEVSRG